MSEQESVKRHEVDWARLGVNETPDTHVTIGSDQVYEVRMISSYEQPREEVRTKAKDAEDYQLLESFRTADGENPYQAEQDEILMNRLRSRGGEEDRTPKAGRFARIIGKIIGNNIRQP